MFVFIHKSDSLLRHNWHIMIIKPSKTDTSLVQHVWPDKTLLTPSIFWGMRVSLFKEWKGWVEQLISCLEPSGIFHFLWNFHPTPPLWMSRFLLPWFFCWNPLKQPFLLPNFLSVPLRGGWIGVCKSADLLWFVNQIRPSIFALNPKSRQNVLITCTVQNPGPKNRWIRNPLQLQDPEIR